MGTIWIKEFTGGLDTRRMAETTAGGVLIKALDGHVTRGGEFEKRAAFVPSYQLPAGTVGMARTSTGLVVFGSASPPGMPSGVTYQQLIHPDGTTQIDRILSYDLNTGLIYVSALFLDGSTYHFYNGVRVTDWADGVARAQIQVAGGTGSSTVTSITINGIEVLGATVTWTTSNANTAALIAAQINTFTSSPDYVASANGATITIKAASAMATPNGFLIVTTVASGMTFSPTSGVTMAGGQAPGSVIPPGPYVRTYGSRELSVSGAVLFGSGIAQPTKWNTDTVGAFFIDMSSQTSTADKLVGVAEYQNLIAVFGETVILTWFIDSDPSNNRKSQTLRNTGAVSGKSITQFGDSDLFYLDQSGLRSLKARDSSNAAATSDIGVPVDTIITAKLQGLTATEQFNIVGIIEPTDGRFWLIMKDTIYVFSFFPGSKVSAWSTYSPGFAITDAVVYKRKAYVRSGDVIYSYGGLTSTLVYDDTVAEAWPPYLDAGSPTTKKLPTGMDVACVGLWNIALATDPVNTDGETSIANVTQTTYSEHGISTVGEATHLQPRFRSSGVGYRKLGAAVIHYTGEPPDED